MSNETQTPENDQQPTPDQAAQQPAQPNIAEPINLDLSKSVSVAPPQAAEDNSGVKLDMTKSVPVQGQPQPEETGFWNRIKANAKGMTVGMYHAFTDPATDAEKRQLMEKVTAEKQWQKDHGYNPDEVPLELATNPSHITLAWHRLVDAPASELLNKSTDTATNAEQLWKAGHRWKAADQYASASADVALSQIPMMGPMLNDIANRAESGDIKGAAGDITFLLAAEHTPKFIADAVKGDAVKLAEARDAHANAGTQHDLRSNEASAALDAAQRASAELQKAKDGFSRGTVTQDQLNDVQSRASDAASEARKAGEALQQAREARNQAAFEEKRISRRISDKAAKAAAAEADKVKANGPKAMELMQKAIPAKGSDFYNVDPTTGKAEKYDIVRSHLEAAKEAGTPIDNIQDARNVAEDARQRIEDKVMGYTDKYDGEALVDEPADTKLEDSKTPKNIVTQKLQEMAKADGNFEGAEKYLNDFNVTDPTVGESKEMLTKLNDHLRQMKKSSNNWDIYNQIETNPKFAAYYMLADEMRDALYNKFESHGVEGIREARGETAALIDFRNMADAQTRANRGATKVRGSGTQSAVRSLIAKLTGKAIKGAGIATGAEMAGPAGAVAGGAVGEMVGEPVEKFIAPQDLTRDEHVGQSMKMKGTLRKPVEIKGAGTEPVIPSEPLPPKPRDIGPEPLQLTPRENTDLHAELAAHFDVTDLKKNTYQELENRLRQEYDDKIESGLKPETAERNLLKKVLQADAADEAARVQAEKTAAQAAAAPKTPELEKIEKSQIAAAEARAAEGEAVKLNPHLVSLGRADESGLVSHSPAMKAHSPALPIDAAEGISSEMAHRHEWSHIALNAIDSEKPSGLSILAKTHPEAEGAATSLFDMSHLLGEGGMVDPDTLMAEETRLLTQKMAGPASHEVFDGMTKDEAMSHPGTRTDLRQARQLVRDIHPEFSASQVEEVVDAAYERARNFLTKPHIADRIKANAAVRETGLNQDYHASRGRVTQFQDDIRKAHEENGNEPQSSGGGAGEGGEKAEKPAAEEGKKNAGGSKERGEAESRKPAEKPATASGRAVKPAVSKERTTGTPEVDEAIRKGGAIPGGTQPGFEYKDKTTGETKTFPDLALFHDEESGTTLAHPKEQVTPEVVADKLRESRAQYAAANQEKSAVAGKYHPDLQKVIDQNKLTDTLPNDASFLTPDGKFVDLSSTHPEAIKKATGEDFNDAALSEKIKNEEPGTEDNRIKFLNDTGAIRTRLRQTMAGTELVASVPKQGATEAQVRALRKAVGRVGREGNLVIERTDATSENPLYAKKEFPRVSDVDQMLRDIQAHPEKNLAKSAVAATPAPTEVAEGANDYNKEHGLPIIDAAPKPHNPEFAKRVADAYDQMKHEPNNPAVKAAYDSMKNAVDDQWDYATQKMGMKFEPWTKEGQPYANSKEMMKDVADNKHLYFFQGGESPVDNPLRATDPKTGLSYNDKFRAVHDLFGHAAHGFEFGPKGEENAYLVHRQMFPKEAVPALTTETRGQNSWVNFGKHLRDEAGNVPKKDETGFVAPADRPYAEQKTGVLPSEFHGTGPLDVDLDKHPAGGIDPRTGSMESKRYGVEIAPEEREILDQKPTAADFQRYADEHANVLKQHPDLKIGWDTLGEKPELNIGVSTDSLDAAKKIGEKLDQRAIWDTQKNEEIPVGGKNTQREFPDYPFADRLKDLEKSSVAKSPKGSSVPPQEVRDSIEKNNSKDVDTKRDIMNALDPKIFESNDWTRQTIQPTDKRIDLEESPFIRNRVNDYKRQFKAGSEFPPVTVIEKSGKFNVVDGVNRLQAAQELGVPVDAYVGKEAKSPKGSSVPLMQNPLPVKGTMEGGEVGTLDVTKALNQFSRKSNPALEPGEAEPKEMVARAKKIAEDEAKYQLAQSKTGTEWYTTEMKDHDKVLQDLRPELAEGPTTDSVDAPGHPVNLTLFKAAEAILSSGQKPYANVKSAVRAWDLYKETGEFPRQNPETGKSWGPRGVNAYGSAFDSVNKLIAEKGEKGAADWLLSEHPVKELRSYQAPGQSPVKGKAADMETGAMILGAKRGPFMQNLHGIESKFTADMWVSRTWNRWMGTLDLDPRIEAKGKMTSESDSPRNNSERSLMKESFEKTANKLGLTTSSLQAVLWYYEQALYRAHGLPVESWSFSDAAKRVAKESKAAPEAEQTGFNFGENAKEKGGLSSLGALPKPAGGVHAVDFLKALGKK
jgi:hypothetical protein